MKKIALFLILLLLLPALAQAAAVFILGGERINYAVPEGYTRLGRKEYEKIYQVFETALPDSRYHIMLIDKQKAKHFKAEDVPRYRGNFVTFCSDKHLRDAYLSTESFLLVRQEARENLEGMQRGENTLKAAIVEESDTHISTACLMKQPGNDGREDTFTFQYDSLVLIKGKSISIHQTQHANTPDDFDAFVSRAQIFYKDLNLRQCGVKGGMNKEGLNKSTRKDLNPVNF